MKTKPDRPFRDLSPSSKPSFRWTWHLVLLALWALMCNLPLTPQGPPGISAESAATMTALFAQVPTLIPTLRAATATPVQPLVMTPTAVLPTPPGPLREGGTVVAHRRTSPPLVDGDLQDWPTLPYLADKVVYGADQWQGPNDVSARFALAWDATHLYLAARVTDDVYAHLAQATGYNLFRGDALEIVFDRDLYGDFSSAQLNDDDYHLGFSPGIGTPGTSPEAYLWFPQGIRGARPQVSVQARPTGQGGNYTIEIAIPWEVLGGPLQVNTYVGFAFRVSDSDQLQQLTQDSMVSNIGPPHVYNKPTTWGNLVLVP